MLKLLLVFGTRPETIKMAPVIAQLKKHPGKFDYRICVTGQHLQMVRPLLELFKIKPDYDLNIMKANQGIEYVTAKVLNGVGKILEKERPDYLVVQGDTTTSMAAALAAFYHKIKIAHIEAGLRTWNKLQPYPEEINRKIIDGLSDLCFAHTEEAKRNLLREGMAREKIEVTGNTVIDALLDVAGRDCDFAREGGMGNALSGDRKIILVTAHRRESFGIGIINICKAIKKIAGRFSSEVCVVYPVHLNPNVQKPVFSMLKGMKNIVLTKPMEYLSFVHLMKRSYLILTDSGGIQEEALTLRVPVLVMREVSERPEGVRAGGVEIVGTRPEKIVAGAARLLKDNKKYIRMSRARNPYGDGKAAERIVARLMKE